MEFYQKMLFFFDYFTMGLLAPVLSLVALAHGATVETLALYVGLFAITVILFEVPSGMFADLFGRKNCFILAHVCGLLHGVFTFVSHGPLLLAIAYVFHGLGRAFGSGSLEALMVEECIKKDGEEAVAKANSELLLISGMATALGAILGGIIGNIGQDYSILLVVLIAVEMFLIILSIIFIKETWERPIGNSMRENLSSQIRLMLEALKTSQTMVYVLIMASLMACSLLIVEVYWQQNLVMTIPQNMIWIFGVVSCLGYVGVSLGSKIGEKLGNERKGKQKLLYWTFRVLHPVAVVALGMCKRWYFFVIIYTVAYVILGVGDLFEKTLLHENVENRYRASMLSLYSLFIRGGGMVASILASGIVAYGGVSLAWVLVPVVAVGLMILVELKF